MEGWNPLSEDEEKRLKAKRERSSKISKIMGNYLLRGYKMLGTTCNKCETILLQDRQGEDYCIGCCEIDNVNDFPNGVNHQTETPVVSATKTENMEVVSSSSNVVSREGSSLPYVNESMKTITELLYELNTDNVPGRPSTVTEKIQWVTAIKTCYETLNFLETKK